MKILVTGGKGMLANAIRTVQAGFDDDVSFCDRGDLDITDLNSVLMCLINERYDVLINCAAYTNVDAAETDADTAYAVNAMGAGNLAIAANRVGAMLIHISTDAVYDGRKVGLYTESDDCNPLSVYSKTKYAGEIEIMKNHDFGIIIRTSWLYSASKKNFVTTIINKAKQTGHLNVVCDQLGTPTYANDLATAILDIVRSNRIQPGSGINIYHYSNEGAISWYDFAVNICRILQINTTLVPVGSHQYSSNVCRPFHSVMSKEKIKQDFGLVIPYWRDSLEICLSAYNSV